MPGAAAVCARLIGPALVLTFAHLLRDVPGSSIRRRVQACPVYRDVPGGLSLSRARARLATPEERPPRDALMDGHHMSGTTLPPPFSLPNVDDDVGELASGYSPGCHKRAAQSRKHAPEARDMLIHPSVIDHRHRQPQYGESPGSHGTTSWSVSAASSSPPAPGPSSSTTAPATAGARRPTSASSSDASAA